MRNSHIINVPGIFIYITLQIVKTTFTKLALNHNTYYKETKQVFMPKKDILQTNNNQSSK